MQFQRPPRQGEREAKLDALRKATEYALPTGSIDQLLREIGRGYVPNPIESHDEVRKPRQP